MSNLRQVPGIGEHKEQLLIALGYDSLEKLKTANPEELYIQASAKQGWLMDKCVLYAFRCAVAYANDNNPNPANYRWWFFCDEHKENKNGKYKKTKLSINNKNPVKIIDKR